MKPEFYPDMSIDDYHATKDFLSKSMMVDLLPPSCPAKFKYLHLDGNKKEETKSLRLGSAVHVLALEPNLFHSQFYLLPEGIRRDTRTAAYREHLDEANGRTILSASEQEQIMGMAESLANDKTAITLLKADGYVEGSIFWTETDGDIKMRCRPDLMRNDGLIVDLKTCSSAHKDAFEKVAFDKHYALSVAVTSRGYAALYGKPIENYVFLAVESSPPYIVEAYDAFRPFENGVSYADVGEAMYDLAMNTYAHCRDNNYWPKYNTKPITEMGVPYYKKKFLDTGEL